MQNYKMLLYEGIRYDSILLSIIDEIAERWPGIATEKFFLTGYSGGGQFVLRFFYLHPSRLEAVSVGAPGLVTQLDHTLNWPRGIKGVESIFDGLSVDLSALKKVEEIQLIVGGDDVQKVGGGFVEWFREREEMKKEIKDLISSLPNRKDALLKLKETFNSAGVTVEFEIIDGVAHNSARAAVKVIEFLEPLLMRWHVE